jgi:pyrimidine operon attenuation protein/uracil phosphoribosyltransferase
MNANASRVLILDGQRIERKLVRMAWQIWEHNSNRKSITLVGIADNGIAIAQQLAEHLRKISPLKVDVRSLTISKKDPVTSPVTLDGPIQDASIVLVDDVANSGKTLMYALLPILEAAPEKVLITVLVDRKHKSFPVAPDIIGHQLATTLQEHIIVQIDEHGMAAYLE